MIRDGFTVVTDRGGHLHNALMLIEQMGLCPRELVTTHGPDIAALKSDRSLKGTRIFQIPYLFSWRGKRRVLNPLLVFSQWVFSGYLAFRLRPKAVVSVGATNVVFFCYWAKLFGAKIYHVECMNQVTSRSITGRLLYPVCTALYVQWKDLLQLYGPKAQYQGWVL